MEQNNKVNFLIVCNAAEYLNETILWYNNTYKTDLVIKRQILDEVNFAEIEVSNYKTSDIFDLGYHFGAKEQKMRQERKIDW